MAGNGIRLNLTNCMYLCCAALIVLLGTQYKVATADGHRFFYEGDGHITLIGEKSGHKFEGAYRTMSGQYEEKSYRAICRVFGAPYNPVKTGLSWRLVAFLDFLEDHFGPGHLVTITSGYRNPEYNTRLRQGGGLAAKASLHQYGMAADIIMAGVPSEQIWHYVQKLGFGGTGYYHGKTVHLDVGPARSWDETTSGVGTGLSDENKLIGLVTDFDRYHPNDRVVLRFIRMTAFPVGVVPEFALHRIKEGTSKEVVRFVPDFGTPNLGSCPQMSDMDQMASLKWRLPDQLPRGRYTIIARFCHPAWDKMPVQVVTPAFEIVTP